MPFGSDIFSSLIRGKPDMPAFKPIDLSTEQTKAISANQGALGADEKLAGEANQFNRDQIQKMLDQSIPGFETMKGDMSTNIEAMLTGKLPLNDERMSELSSVARSFGGGYGGSGMGGDLVARDLGLSEIGEIDKGMSSAENWMKTMASIEQPGMFNLSSMFVTPGEETSLDVEERNSQFQHDWAKNLIDWQSSLGYAAADDMESTTTAIGSMISSSAGAAAGGGSSL